ncbi:MAG: hypothetical protein ACKO01_11650 [Erythrobacter sp.]
MKLGWPVFAALATALLYAPLAAAEPEPPRDIVFAGDVYDVTGAGTLDLGNVEAVLKPFLRDFERGGETLPVDATVDAEGVVQDCRVGATIRLAAVGEALCAEARRAGRFRRFATLALDYTRAVYRLHVRSLGSRSARGRAAFLIVPGFPYRFRSVLFEGCLCSPDGDRLTLADLEYRPMAYPADALQNEIQAQVVVALTFDAEGRVALCRPIWSSNTARMAYETCAAAQQSFTLRRPPDTRTFVWQTDWRLEE